MKSTTLTHCCNDSSSHVENHTLSQYVAPSVLCTSKSSPDSRAARNSPSQNGKIGSHTSQRNANSILPDNALLLGLLLQPDGELKSKTARGNVTTIDDFITVTLENDHGEPTSCGTNSDNESPTNPPIHCELAPPTDSGKKHSPDLTQHLAARLPNFTVQDHQKEVLSQQPYCPSNVTLATEPEFLKRQRPS